MSSFAEIAAGTAVEISLFLLFSVTVYRLVGGRFLIPKRFTVPPYQSGVIVQGTRTIRVVETGTCWVRPKQRIILCDVRPRSLQMVGIEALAQDGGVVRISISGEYFVSDPAMFIGASREAASTFVAAVRRYTVDAVREQASVTIVSDPVRLAARIRTLTKPEGTRLGLDFISLEVWESLRIGWVQPPIEEEPIRLLQ